jgi:hypothetical protein
MVFELISRELWKLFVIKSKPLLELSSNSTASSVASSLDDKVGSYNAPKASSNDIADLLEFAKDVEKKVRSYVRRFKSAMHSNI